MSQITKSERYDLFCMYFRKLSIQPDSLSITILYI